MLNEFCEHRPLRSGDLNGHDTVKMHIHDSGLAGINRGAAKGRISAAVADHYEEFDAGTCLSWIPAAIERRGRHISVAPPTVGWREDALLRLVLEHRKEPYDKYRCGARFEFFQQSDARTIPALVNMGGITTDILFNAERFMPMALDS
jgi:hypothetical protein